MAKRSDFYGNRPLRFGERSSCAGCSPCGSWSPLMFSPPRHGCKKDKVPNQSLDVPKMEFDLESGECKRFSLLPSGALFSPLHCYLGKGSVPSPFNSSNQRKTGAEPIFFSLDTRRASEFFKGFHPQNPRRRPSPKKNTHLGVDSFSILFSHRSSQKPDPFSLAGCPEVF